MRRVHVSVRIDVDVAGTPSDNEARRISPRQIKRWLDAGMSAPEPSVSLDVRHAQMGRVSRRGRVG